MNTYGNARTRKTQKKLHAALTKILADGTKRLSDITVRELCGTADVHKSTFYAHFSGIVPFAENVLTERFAKLNEPISRSMKFASNADFEKQLSAHIVRILGIVRKNRVLCRAYLADSATRERYAACLDRVDEHLIASRTYDTEHFTESEIRYEFASRHASFCAIVQTWLNRDCAENEETVARIVVRKLGT